MKHSKHSCVYCSDFIICLKNFLFPKSKYFVSIHYKLKIKTSYFFQTFEQSKTLQNLFVCQFHDEVFSATFIFISKKLRGQFFLPKLLMHLMLLQESQTHFFREYIFKRLKSASMFSLLLFRSFF